MATRKSLRLPKSRLPRREISLTHFNAAKMAGSNDPFIIRIITAELMVIGGNFSKYICGGACVSFLLMALKCKFEIYRFIAVFASTKTCMLNIGSPFWFMGHKFVNLKTNNRIWRLINGISHFSLLLVGQITPNQPMKSFQIKLSIF